MSFSNNIKKIALSIDKLNDGFDKKYLRVNNPALVLLPKNDRYVLAVIASSKTKVWIANNLDVHCKSDEYGKVAYTLDGVSHKLDLHKIGENAFITTYHGKEVAPLCEHSNKSSRLFWTIKKFDTLDNYDQNKKLDIINLLLLQDDLDDEIAKKQNSKTDNPKQTDEEELSM